MSRSVSSFYSKLRPRTFENLINWVRELTQSEDVEAVALTAIVQRGVRVSWSVDKVWRDRRGRVRRSVRRSGLHIAFKPPSDAQPPRGLVLDLETLQPSTKSARETVSRKELVVQPIGEYAEIERPKVEALLGVECLVRAYEAKKREVRSLVRAVEEHVAKGLRVSRRDVEVLYREEVWVAALWRLTLDVCGSTHTLWVDDCFGIAWGLEPMSTRELEERARELYLEYALVEEAPEEGVRRSWDDFIDRALGKQPKQVVRAEAELIDQREGYASFVVGPSPKYLITLSKFGGCRQGMLRLRVEPSQLLADARNRYRSIFYGDPPSKASIKALGDEVEVWVEGLLGEAVFSLHPRDAQISVKRKSLKDGIELAREYLRRRFRPRRVSWVIERRGMYYFEVRGMGVYKLSKDLEVSKASSEELKRLGIKKRRCVLATAAYGYWEAEELEALRAFRDAFLLQTRIGELVVDSYYWVSRYLVDYVGRWGFVAAAIRALVKIGYPVAKRLARAAF